MVLVIHLDKNTQLLKKLDESAFDYEFLGWQCGEEHALVGAMRASGFTTADHCGLVFEDVEYSLKEGYIQSIAFCVATFPIKTWISIGDAVFVDLTLRESGEFPVSWRTLDVASRNKSFEIDLEKDELVDLGYLDKDADQPTPQAILLKICNSIPAESLFSTEDYLKSAFDMPEDAERIFVIDEWEHPSFDQLYGEAEIQPSSLPDIVAMVDAVCSRQSSPKLTSKPNTSWEQQCADNG